MIDERLLRPSSAARWTTCTKALTFKVVEDDNGGAAAQQGTRAHNLAEHALMFGGVVTQHLAETFATADDDVAEMVDAIKVYCDYINQLIGDSEGYVMSIEERLTMKTAARIPDVSGTADCVVVMDDTVHVIDLKYGKGVRVEATGNEQLMTYACAALDTYDVSKAMVHIVQPRLNHIEVWEPTPSQVKAYRTKVNKAIKAACKGEVEAVPSEKACKWCPAATQCEARKEQAVEAARRALGIDSASRTELLINASLIRDYLAQLESEEFNKLTDGEESETHVLVPKRPTKKWIATPQELQDQFGDAIMAPPTVLSPAAALKAGVLNKMHAHQFIEAKSSGYNLKLKTGK